MTYEAPSCNLNESESMRLSSTLWACASIVCSTVSKTLNKTVNLAIPIAYNEFGILKIDKSQISPQKLKSIFKEALKTHF